MRNIFIFLNLLHKLFFFLTIYVFYDILLLRRLVRDLFKNYGNYLDLLYSSSKKILQTKNFSR